MHCVHMCMYIRIYLYMNATLLLAENVTGVMLFMLRFFMAQVKGSTDEPSSKVNVLLQAP